MKSLQDFLVLILSGILEGVVDERSSGGPHFSHQVRGLINFIFKKYPTRKILQSQLQRPNKNLSTLQNIQRFCALLSVRMNHAYPHITRCIALMKCSEGNDIYFSSSSAGV